MEISNPVKNPFEAPGEAARYDRFRPRYHHLPFAMAREFVGRDFDDALDVACGTGHSTVALAQIAKRVVGCDQSAAMLAQARLNPGIEFVQASAETLPFAPQSFDFVTISMGFHWLDQENFLREVARVLRPGGYLAVDNYGFTGKISANPEKQKMHHELFQNFLPAAGRRKGYTSPEQVAPFGLELATEFKYEHHVPFRAEEFAELIKTWSNYQVLSEDKKQAAAEKMQQVYAQIFAGQTLELSFGGKMQVYRLVPTVVGDGHIRKLL